MRLYSFQNFYLAGIHAGIQTAHTIARMSQKYSVDSGIDTTTHQNAGILFSEWAKRDGGETIIVKNGGMQCDLERTLEFFESEPHNYPFDYFHEAPEALGGAMTNVSIVVPTHIWKLADYLRRTSISYDSYPCCIVDGVEYYLVDTATMAPCGVPWLRTVSELPIINSEQLKQNNNTIIGEVAYIAISEFDKTLITLMNSCGLL